ncbi:MAG: apolipoprotein N-acyltransferase [Microbacterium sp.]|uniref:apolipoprotein N-acyltransferase n=1 Tax=Microbacterium sp. TaxID=51671 RepID=UPI0039E29252
MPATRTTAAPERPVLPLWAALVVSAGAGLLLTTAFPSLAWWPVVFVAVPGTLVPLIGRRVWSSLLVGFVFGAAFFLVNVSFTARYLGPVPWLALTFLEAALTAVAGVTITLAYRWLPRLLAAPWWRLTLLPALVAALWTMREQFLGSWPYGGFPWARIGVTQASSPLAPVASWVGISGLTFLIVFVAAAAVEFVRVARRRPLTALPALVVLIALFLVPQFPTTDAGSLRVGAVQGNGPAGYFDTRSRNAVLEAQLTASEALVGQGIDVLLWPEGGVDSDPLTSATTAAALDALSESVDAPLLMNAATARGGQYFNSSMLWVAGEGATDIYDKRHLVPFGEYVPDRSVYAQLAPDLIGLLQLDETPGTAAPVMDVAGTTVGLAICFDVIYDDVIWDGAADGAEVYLLQTNNADFRGTDENLQQLAFARMRAIETGRAVVNLSTVGTSQVIAPDGSVIDGLEEDTAGAMVTDVPLRTGLTPAVVIGPWIQVVLGWGSLVAVAACGVLVWVRRRRTIAAPAPEGAGAAIVG